MSRNRSHTPRNLLLAACAMVVLLAALGAAPASAGTKVEICHIPPGNPANFHTITVSDKALPAHFAHGDLPGDCFSNCGTLCDDGDACTIDACDENEVCLADHPPVDCDDSNPCTIDSCDPEAGCQYAPVVCDDEDLCTVDTCNPYDGQCAATPIDCGPLGICLPDSGQCNFPCDGITCDPISQCHEAGECVLPGECVDGQPLADGTPCDDGNPATDEDECTGGICAGVAGCDAPAPEDICPCWTLEDLEALELFSCNDYYASYNYGAGDLENLVIIYGEIVEEDQWSSALNGYLDGNWTNLRVYWNERPWAESIGGRWCWDTTGATIAPLTAEEGDACYRSILRKCALSGYPELCEPAGPLPVQSCPVPAADPNSCCNPDVIGDCDPYVPQ